MELIAGEPDFVVEHVSNLPIFTLFTTNKNASTSLIVDLFLTFAKFIGTPACIANMSGWLKSSGRRMASWPMCLPELAHLPFQRGKKDARF